MLNELRDLDFNDIGSAPSSVRYLILGFLLVIILGIGYFLLIKDKIQQLEMVQGLENNLRAEFEQKQFKAANLEAYLAAREEAEAKKQQAARVGEEGTAVVVETENEPLSENQVITVVFEDADPATA